MVTVSLCMIVKNEERILGRCLDSIADLADEIIIVDTGSEDGTKRIASEYTDQVYDFEWTGDFSAARNFAFSKASMDYIYSADADEVLDEENRERFLRMKEVMLPEIEIVQMKYANQLSQGTVYNFDEEYRPKMFKRVRSFQWIDPVHETVRTDPVVYDSDVVICHLPEENHSGRDFAAFSEQIGKGKKLSARLRDMYAKELFISGEEQDFLDAYPYFKGCVDAFDGTEDEMTAACCVLARGARIQEDHDEFFKYAVKAVTMEGCSEICCELGLFYLEKKDYEEAEIWFYNAWQETAPILNIQYGFQIPLEKLARCYEAAGEPDRAEECRKKLREET